MKLKRCPFCSGPASALMFRVVCPNCGAEGPNGEDSTQAVRLWNMRGGKT